jgi:hypothetical protein
MVFSLRYSTQSFRNISTKIDGAQSPEGSANVSDARDGTYKATYLGLFRYSPTNSEDNAIPVALFQLGDGTKFFRGREELSETSATSGHKDQALCAQALKQLEWALDRGAQLGPVYDSANKAQPAVVLWGPTRARGLKRPVDRAQALGFLPPKPSA